MSNTQRELTDGDPSHVASPPPSLPEPTDAAPLQIRRIQWLLLLVLGGVPAALGWVGYEEGVFLRHLMNDGRVVSSEVLNKHMHSCRSVDYYVDTAFYLDGERFEVCGSVSRDRYRTTTVGDPIEVTFLDSEPERARIDRVTGDQIERQQLATVIGGVLSLLTIGIVMFVLERARRNSRTTQLVGSR